MLYLRDPSGETLQSLADELSTNDETWGGVTSEVHVERQGEILALTFGRNTVPVTKDGMEQIASFLDVPRNFLLTRLDSEMQQYVLNGLLERNAANLGIRYSEGGVHEVYKPDRVRIDPRQIVDAAIKVMPLSAPVVEWSCDPDELMFDVMVPEDFDAAIGGDPQINDISRGGLRFFQDRKNNHAPSVASYIYRLACTNGMVVPDTGLKIDARGSTVEAVLAELELAAEHAFNQVEEQIEHFYALRNQQIEGDVTQAVLQVARERGLPDRTGMTLARRVPDQLTSEALGHDPTMFDLVNLITNQANAPALRGRRGPRRQLMMAGGALVREVHDRCSNCHQVID